LNDDAINNLYNPPKIKEEEIEMENDIERDEEIIDDVFKNKHHSRKKKRKFVYSSSSEEESGHRDHNPNFKAFNEELKKLKKRKIRQEM